MSTPLNICLHGVRSIVVDEVVDYPSTDDLPGVSCRHIKLTRADGFVLDLSLFSETPVNLRVLDINTIQMTSLTP